MRSTIVGMALMSSVVAAQSSVVTLFVFGFDQQQLEGSILGSDATATTYSIDCAPGTDSASCGLPPGGMTVVQGPKTMHAYLNYGGTANLYAEAGCQLNTAASEAVYSEIQEGSAAPYSGTTSATFTGTDYNGFLFPVTITAGSASGAPASTAASATAPTVSATTTSAANSAAASTTVLTGSGMTTVTSPATTAASSTKVSTGGMPQSTGNAQWAMGGVAVAVALAAL